MSKNLTLLIPGNPSVPGIYEPFLKSVTTSLNLEDSPSFVLPHLGQCNRLVKRHKNLNVHDVIEDHKENIHKLIQEYLPEKVILIGHSLGSAITISLYKDFSKKIDNFVVLCPFLGPSENNKGYLKLFANPITRMGMEGITYSALKSQKLSYHIFKRWLGETPFNHHIPNEIKKPYYTKNFFTLVSNYFDDFEKLNLKREIKEMCPQKSFFIFAPNDYWVPDDTIFHLPQNSHFRKLQDISHDFCLREDQYSRVAKAIAKHLKSLNNEWINFS